MNAQEIIREAENAGLLAIAQCHPKPMIVGQAMDLVSNEMVPGTEEYVADGVCGFAWVDIYPRHSKENKDFINALKKEDLVELDSNSPKSYPFSKVTYQGPVHYQYWCSFGNQSMQKKEAFCNAFVEVLKKYNITAYVGSRMD